MVIYLFVSCEVSYADHVLSPEIVITFGLEGRREGKRPLLSSIHHKRMNVNVTSNQWKPFVCQSHRTAAFSYESLLLSLKKNDVVFSISNTSFYSICQLWSANIIPQNSLQGTDKLLQKKRSEKHQVADMCIISLNIKISSSC